MVGSKVGLAGLDRRLVEAGGFGGPPDRVIISGEARAGDQRVVVVGSELRFVRFESRLEQGDGLSCAAGGVIGFGKTLASAERFGMVGPELGLEKLRLCLSSAIARRGSPCKIKDTPSAERMDASTAG